MLLEKHFNFKTFTHSPTADKFRIDNTQMDEIVLHNLTRLHSFLLEIQARLSTKFGKVIQIRINSAYRCPELNERVGGSKTSQHTKGEAADTVAIGITFDEYYNALRELAKSGAIKFGQVIKEYGKNPETNADDWLHISLPKNKINDFLIKEQGQAYRKDPL